MGQWLEPVESSAGLHLTAYTRAGIDADALCARALEQQVGVYSLRPYYLHQRGRAGLVFGYGAIGEADIEAGLARLRRLCSTN